MTSERRAVVVFDGVCNLCNWSAQFIIRNDPDGYFRFASLQSAAGARLVEGCPHSATLDSVALIEEGRCYVESAAALRIARRLSGPWPLLYLLILIPSSIRDQVYRFVARNRYRWFGRRDSCLAPSPEHRARFLEDPSVI